MEDVIAEGDNVVVRATNTVVQDSFFGIPRYRRQHIFTAYGAKRPCRAMQHTIL